MNPIAVFSLIMSVALIAVLTLTVMEARVTYSVGARYDNAQEMCVEKGGLYVRLSLQDNLCLDKKAIIE